MHFIDWPLLVSNFYLMKQLKKKLQLSIAHISRKYLEKICYLQLQFTWLGQRVTGKFLLHPWLVYLPLSEQGLRMNLFLSPTFAIKALNFLSTETDLVLLFCLLNDFSLLGMFISTLYTSTLGLWHLSWWSRVERFQGKYLLI